jgi:hypothetical protein
MFQPIDREAEALKDLGRRVSRVRGWVAGLSISIALVAGAAGYILLRQLLFDLVGAHSPYVTGAVTIGLALSVGHFATTWIGRLVVRWRSGAWIEAARARYEVAADPLRQYLDIWR